MAAGCAASDEQADDSPARQKSETAFRPAQCGPCRCGSAPCGAADSGKSLPFPEAWKCGGCAMRWRFARFPTQKRLSRMQLPPKRFCYPVELGPQAVEVALLEQSCCLRFTVIDWPPQGRETNVTGAVLDRDRIRLPLVVRNWRPGDSMQPVGHQKRHKLSRLLNELGVSRWDKVWLARAGLAAKQSLWARGLPVSAEFAPSEFHSEGVVITEVPIS